jgi:hypothetical protein
MSRRFSFELVKNAIEILTADKIADETRLKRAIVYKWGESPEDFDAEDPDIFFSTGSGKTNPLDRTGEILSLLAAEEAPEAGALLVEIIDWLCAKARGAFISDEQLAAIEQLCAALKSPKAQPRQSVHRRMPTRKTGTR